MKRRTFIGAGAASALLPVLPNMAAPRSPLDDRVSDKLARSVVGPVYRPGSAEYERLRRGFAAEVDLRPAFVFHPLTTKDVATGVRFALEHHMPLAVRCGGHSYAGYSTCADGMIVDLSGLRSIEVAPDRASVRIGGGALVGHVEVETARFGRAMPFGQCPSVGAGGYLLGGGVGPLMSAYGLGCDNILSAEMVLADGRIVSASAESYPDLYWAIRGGGGNFGIATAFTLKLHPVSTVFGGFLTFRAAEPEPLMIIMRDLAASAAETQTLIGTLAPEEREAGYSLTLQLCDVGDSTMAEQRLSRFRSSALLANDTVKRQSYLALEQQVPFDIPATRRENRGGFFPELNDAVIAALSAALRKSPDRLGDVTFMHLHGAVTRVGLADTAFPLRERGFAHNIAARWTPATGQARAAAWVRNTARDISPYGVGAYVNVMGREGSDAVRAAYARNYPRLATIKARYDPGNLFRINQNILPA